MYKFGPDTVIEVGPIGGSYAYAIDHKLSAERYANAQSARHDARRPQVVNADDTLTPLTLPEPSVSREIELVLALQDALEGLAQWGDQDYIDRAETALAFATGRPVGDSRAA